MLEFVQGDYELLNYFYIYFLQSPYRFFSIETGDIKINILQIIVFSKKKKNHEYISGALISKQNQLYY